MLKAKLIAIRGDEDGEFSGMIGYNGKLIERPGGYSFLCENGDTVTIPVKSQERDGDILFVKSKATGHGWKFRIIPVQVSTPQFAEDVKIRPTLLN